MASLLAHPVDVLVVQNHKAVKCSRDCFITHLHVGKQSIMMSACVYVPANISPELHDKSSPNFAACDLWRRFDAPTALRYVTYFRFYGWRHICTQWPGIGDTNQWLNRGQQDHHKHSKLTHQGGKRVLYCFFYFSTVSSSVDIIILLLLLRPDML